MLDSCLRAQLWKALNVRVRDLDLIPQAVREPLMVLVKRRSMIRAVFSRDELVDRVGHRTESALRKAKGECRKHSQGRCTWALV